MEAGLVIIGLVAIVATVAIVAIVFGRGLKSEVATDKVSIEIAPDAKRESPA